MAPPEEDLTIQRPFPANAETIVAIGPRSDEGQVGDPMYQVVLASLGIPGHRSAATGGARGADHPSGCWQKNGRPLTSVHAVPKRRR